jgi:hypothetical protein
MALNRNTDGAQKTEYSRTEATCRTQTVQSLRRAQIALREIGVALHAASPERIIVTGGGLFAVTFALGGMLSQRRIQCPVIIEDQYGNAWGLPGHDNGQHRVSKMRPVAVAHPNAKSGRVAVLIGGSKTDPKRLFGPERGVSVDRRVGVSAG